MTIKTLKAINDHTNPDPEDVDLLRDYFPERRDCEPDVLACSVIQEWLHGERAW